jgi:hypothetical protein
MLKTLKKKRPKEQVKNKKKYLINTINSKEKNKEAKNYFKK